MRHRLENLRVVWALGALKIERLGRICPLTPLYSQPHDMTMTSTPSTDLIPPSVEPTCLVPPPNKEVCYISDAGMSTEGLGHHLERSIWQGVTWPNREVSDINALLAEGARVAATQYVERIGRMTLGLLGPVHSSRHHNTVYFSPFGFKILKIMGFGEFEEDGCGELSTGVHSGFLMASHAEESKRGRLFFRWKWSPERKEEVFETEVRDYTPRLLGRKGRWWGRLLYRLTQVNFHRMVMWGYHWWVRRHRESLLIQAAKQLENKRLGTSADASLDTPETRHARLTTDTTTT